MNAEEKRLKDAKTWKHWGPYLSERAWGTVREDYSRDGAAWDFFPHDHARLRAYRWNEDGIAGICDENQTICFAVAFWNGKDPILKERIFGLTGSEGNHGEDVKEYYFYADSTPTHSFMKYLYKYPQSEFPYAPLIEENRNAGKSHGEFELLDTGVFDDNRYFDCFVEYAKADAEDILIKITIANRGADTARINVLPTVWARNVWSWNGADPDFEFQISDFESNAIEGGEYQLFCENADELLFCENNTNKQKLFGAENETPFVKDGINDYIVNGKTNAVNPAKHGTKAAANYLLELRGGEEKMIRLRLKSVPPVSAGGLMAGTRPTEVGTQNAFADFDKTFAQRRSEADEFYAGIIPANLSADAKSVMRQAFAGMLWSKQFYHYDVEKWLDGDDEFVEACLLDEIPEKRACIRTISGERVAVFRYDGKISAVSNVCQHQNGPLGEGRIIDGCITCPWHGFQYRPESGAAPPPFTEKVPTFNVKIADGKVFVSKKPNKAGTRVEPVVLSEPPAVAGG